ncbi:hypothetical protein C1H46_039254 [Malus baccata]|uniref:Uncharacterized protein n=1 Tax=Malus baccata TaxID=106549 RepID=A0A540KLX1_MALBA|nr:hypothetical protein C1H46_039254 [Malus baccata]
MYVTKPLSVYRRSPQSLSYPPSEGPNSSYLVLHDDESVEINCCGCEDNECLINPCPPIDTMSYFEEGVIKACTDTKEEDTDIGCCGDGFPPYFLRRKGWNVRMSTPYRYQSGEALGLNSSLRASLPGFDFPPSHECSEVVCVGKWYCPFMFVKEVGVKLKDQMKYSMYYEIKLEQRWEKIFDNVNDNAERKKNPAVFVDAFVQGEVVYVGGRVWGDGWWRGEEI